MLKILLTNVLILAFGANVLGPLPLAQADDFRLPVPGAMVHVSPEFTPAYLKGIVVHPEDPLKFDFIVHKGDEPLTRAQQRQEYTKLIKYFLASLAVPDEDQWVNLSPYEKDRIIKDDFGRTQMGRDLLAEDYMLKQVTASLIYPEDRLGKEFWSRVYAEAQAKYHTTNIPVNTFNKVWVVPAHAVIYEHGHAAYVLESRLKVMLEEDYLSLAKHLGRPGDIPPKGTCPQAVCQADKPLNTKATQGKHGIDTPGHSMASQIIRTLVLPEIEKEVNEGKDFALLRQAYSGMLLAAWYKRVLKDSWLGKAYADQNKIKGVEQPDVKANRMIYRRYLEAFRKGVFNYIKEDPDPLNRQTIPRKYFSGGIVGMNNFAQLARIVRRSPGEEIKRQLANEEDVSVDMAMLNIRNQGLLKAMRTTAAAFSLASLMLPVPSGAQIMPNSAGAIYRTVEVGTFMQDNDPSISRPVSNMVLGMDAHPAKALFPDAQTFKDIAAVFHTSYYLDNADAINASGVLTIKQMDHNNALEQGFRVGQTELQFLGGIPFLNTFMISAVSPNLKQGTDAIGPFFILEVPQAELPGTGEKEGIIFRPNGILMTDGLISHLQAYYKGKLLKRSEIIDRTKAVNTNMQHHVQGTAVTAGSPGRPHEVVIQNGGTIPVEQVIGLTYSALMNHLIIINLNNNSLPQANVVNLNLKPDQQGYFITGAVGDRVGPQDMTNMGFEPFTLEKNMNVAQQMDHPDLIANTGVYRFSPTTADPRIQRYTYKPGATSGTLQEEDVVLYPQSMDPTSRQNLLIFLPGTNPLPSSDTPPILPYIFTAAAAAGLPVLFLPYNNKQAVDQLCPNAGPACAGLFREKRFFGISLPGASMIDDQPWESIVNRIYTGLVFLYQAHPEQGWGRYLIFDDHGRVTGVNWGRIVLTGHSQGAGMVPFAAEQLQLAGGFSISGPEDHLIQNGADFLSPWIVNLSQVPNATPPENIVTMFSTRERDADLLATAADELGIPSRNQIVFREVLPQALLTGNNPYHLYMDNGKTLRAKNGNFDYYAAFYMAFLFLNRAYLFPHGGAFVDPAQLAPSKRNPGGIDFNSAHLDLTVKRTGPKMVLPLGQGLHALGPMEGLEPVIVSIKSAAGLASSF